MSNTFNNWVNQVAKDDDIKPLATGEIVKASKAEPFGAVEFVKIEKTHFIAEVGKKGKIYIYHFYPSKEWLGRVASVWQELKEAFGEIFPDNGEVELDWVEEMLSWAVRVNGWGDHVWGDELALRVIDVADQKLTEREQRYAPGSVPK